MKSTHFIPIFCLSLIACHSNAQQSSAGGQARRPQVTVPTRPGTDADLQLVYNTLHFPEGLSSPSIRAQSRGAEYHPKAILRRLHTWFDDNRNLSLIQVGGYQILKLAPIPRSVHQEIRFLLSRLGVPAPGFAILSANFWDMLVTKQSTSRTEFGFLVASPDPVAGVNFMERRLVGFDIFSNPGTLVHELRHSEQHSRMRRRQELPQELDEASLTSSCLSSLSTFFGELDATTQQLPEWRNSIASLKVVVTSYEDFIRLPELHEMAVPLTLTNNLSYPEIAAMNVLLQDQCPAGLNSVVQQIQTLVIEQKNRIIQAGLRRIQEIHTESTNRFFESRNANVLDLTSEVPRLQQAVESALAEISSTRESEIQRILCEANLNPEWIAELKANALGFEHLSNCE